MDLLDPLWDNSPGNGPDMKHVSGGWDHVELSVFQLLRFPPVTRDTQLQGESGTSTVVHYTVQNIPEK